MSASKEHSRRLSSGSTTRTSSLKAAAAAPTAALDLQSCTASSRLLGKLKKDVDDASDEDYLLWQSDQPQSNAAQLAHPEISPTQAVHYIQTATLEHACCNSWASVSVSVSVSVCIGALLHCGTKRGEEGRENNRCKHTKDAAKAFISAIVNINNLECIKDAVAEANWTQTQHALEWIDETKNKLEVAKFEAQLKLSTQKSFKTMLQGTSTQARIPTLRCKREL